MMYNQCYGKREDVQACVAVVVKLLSHGVFSTMYQPQPKFQHKVDIITFLGEVCEKPWSSV